MSGVIPSAEVVTSADPAEEKDLAVELQGGPNFSSPGGATNGFSRENNVDFCNCWIIVILVVTPLTWALMFASMIHMVSSSKKSFFLDHSFQLYQTVDVAVYTVVVILSYLGGCLGYPVTLFVAAFITLILTAEQGLKLYFHRDFDGAQELGGDFLAYSGTSFCEELLDRQDYFFFDYYYADEISDCKGGLAYRVFIVIGLLVAFVSTIIAACIISSRRRQAR